MRYNERGEEMPDPTPIALPVGFQRPPTIDELYARLVHDPAVQRELSDAGFETEEEANDFDVPDEMPDPTSPFQQEDSVITEADEIRNGYRPKVDLNAVYIKAKKEAEANKKPEPSKPVEGEITDAKP